MKTMTFLGIPYAAGQPDPGVKLGPQMFREAGVLRELGQYFSINDLNDLTGLNHDNNFSNEMISAYKVPESDFHVNFGGDHGLAVGTIHAQLLKHPDLIVVWVDAHGDINPPEKSSTGNFHGMPLAYLLGISKFPWMKTFLSSQRLVFWGPRSLDEAEKDIIRDHGITCFAGEDLNHPELLVDALRKIDPAMKSPVHLSFDVDVYRTEDFPSTGCLTDGGPTKTMIENMGQALFSNANVVSMDLVEFNPLTGDGGTMLRSLSHLSAFLKLNS